jgi:hypothetical protein
VAPTVCPPNADALGVLEAPTGGLAAPAAFSLDDSLAGVSVWRGGSLTRVPERFLIALMMQFEGPCATVGCGRRVQLGMLGFFL